MAADLGGHAEVVSVDEAVERADVLVFAVWLDAFRQLIAQYGGRLAGKVIVDPSNPVGPDGAGGYRKVIGEQESSGQILAGLLPPGARLVKAFGTLSAPSLAAAAHRQPERAVQFFAADDAAAGDLVADLIRADGYEPVRWTSRSASRCSATCTNTALLAGSSPSRRRWRPSDAVRPGACRAPSM